MFKVQTAFPKPSPSIILPWSFVTLVRWTHCHFTVSLCFEALVETCAREAEVFKAKCSGSLFTVLLTHEANQVAMSLPQFTAP